MSARSMRYFENAHISLDYEMIDIDDERRIDEYLNESPRCDLSHVSMSNSKNNEASTPSIVEVESSDSSTSDRNFNDNENDHSSEDNLGNEDNNEVEDSTLQSKNPNTKQIPIAVASTIYTSIDTFFDSTIPTAIPIGIPSTLLAQKLSMLELFQLV